eukprot:CAMPEP_0195030112 /NCGR_PEP_ID=MMETSP0326_2-20130528/58196_1 /TAXON_ID=2866 ORGANISM="Crypthecodinium cohnii, Strain Seligo" /NCGR_SAMPLE_ID=MMETSP0326_2 /ASSEMBLY_ACC=CAM_ASM_000348 /LENGTH=53 /DNA_ID=CAMNT_0040053287 /DNA_START=131 /DNA_END=289 /DNA_ORIENTATION=+
MTYKKVDGSDSPTAGTLWKFFTSGDPQSLVALAADGRENRRQDRVGSTPYMSD